MYNPNEVLANLLTAVGQKTKQVVSDPATGQAIGKNYADTPGPVGVLSALIQKKVQDKVAAQYADAAAQRVQAGQHPEQIMDDLHKHLGTDPLNPEKLTSTVSGESQTPVVVAPTQSQPATSAEPLTQEQPGYQPPKMGVLDYLFPNYSPKFTENMAYSKAMGSGMGSISGKVSEAKQVPLNQAQEWEKQYQERSLAATGYQSQVGLINDELQRIEAAKKDTIDQIKAMSEFRGPIAKFTGSQSPQIKQLTKQLGSLRNYESKIHERFVGLVGQQPNKSQRDSGLEKTPSGTPYKIKG